MKFAIIQRKIKNKTTFCVAGLLVLMCISVSSQNPVVNKQHLVNSIGQTILVTNASYFRVISPLKEWEFIDSGIKKSIEVREHTKQDGCLKTQHTASTDPVIQISHGIREAPLPLINIEAQSGNGHPPDPSGAAGPNHYVQVVNTTFRVFDKKGGPLTGIIDLTTLWPDNHGGIDPIVMYDRHADRWFISLLHTSQDKILVAISKTNDPTGSYYSYVFNFSEEIDYPKYSVWWDGYYMSSNSLQTAIVFQRDVMLAGDPNAKMIALSLPGLNSGGFKSPLPSDADGDLPPNGAPCYFFNLEDDAFNGVGQDQIEIYEMKTNWDYPEKSQVASIKQLRVAPFNSVFSGGFEHIPQPGTTKRLDAIPGVFMYRAQHMRWFGYNTMVLSHAVNLGGNRAAVRWYELRDNSDGNWRVYQSGTYAPDEASRWMSSAAMDTEGNIGIAYSVCDSLNNVFAGIRFTGRLAGDPPGEMTFLEQTAVEGTGAQTNPGRTRFGDYAHLSLDPDGTTFWHTGEYLGYGGSVHTRIFSFNLYVDEEVENEKNKEILIKISNNNSFLEVWAGGIYNYEKIAVDLIGLDGRIILSDTKWVYNTKVSCTFDISGFKPGIYFVRIGNKDFQKTKRFVLK